jgi:hypothetical protein
VRARATQQRRAAQIAAENPSDGSQPLGLGKAAWIEGRVSSTVTCNICLQYMIEEQEAER